LDIICPCEPGQTTKTCEFEITYTNQYGIEHKIKQTITIECSEETTAQNPTPPQETTLQNCFDLTKNPVPICTLTDLNRIREDLTKNYELKTNIDASETITWDEGKGWQPIGNSSTEFEGNFNGNNYKINNLHVDRSNTNYVGFFGYVSGNISNIGLENVNIVGEEYVGGLVGSIEGNITNSNVTGNVDGELFVGGLVGSLEGGVITNSYSDIIIFKNGEHYYVGGLIGESYHGQIFNSYTKGEISLRDGFSVGGLIGDMMGGSIENSYSTINITIYGSEAVFVGGLVGYFDSGAKVNNSYSIGNVNTDVSISTYIGGFIGWDNSVNNPVNSGWWTGAEPNSAIGNPDGNITYNENNVSAFYNSTHGVYTAIEPQWTFGLDGNWVVVENNYPILRWQVE
jgi:hypothetical protein